LYSYRPGDLQDYSSAVAAQESEKFLARRLSVLLIPPTAVYAIDSTERSLAVSTMPVISVVVRLMAQSLFLQPARQSFSPLLFPTDVCLHDTCRSLSLLSKIQLAFLSPHCLVRDIDLVVVVVATDADWVEPDL